MKKSADIKMSRFVPDECEQNWGLENNRGQDPGL
jgi:hypothetical protein